jgi:UDP-glucose 4-epimerase
MKILITGVAGFIGSNLAKSLLANENEVIGIDNLSYGFMRNIEDFLNNENFRFIQGDLANPLILNDIKVDLIIHLASLKIPRYSNALRTLDENYLMLRNIVNKCILDKSRIIFASTSDIYGKNPNMPFHEDSEFVLGSSTVKRWSYALSKIYGEQYIIANHDEYGLEYTIARFFSSYGPNQNLTWWGGVQSAFIEKAIKKEPMELHGDGLQSRTFTYIEDTVTALKLCIENERSINEIFNIGPDGDSEISIKDLAILIWKMINGDSSEPLIKYIPYSHFGNYEDVMRRVPDISKIRKLLNFQPKWNLYDGMIKTIEWQKKIIYNATLTN